MVDFLHELHAALLGSGLHESELLHELVGFDLLFRELDFVGFHLDFAHLR